jgi:hypothetical protein
MFSLMNGSTFLRASRRRSSFQPGGIASIRKHSDLERRNADMVVNSCEVCVSGIGSLLYGKLVALGIGSSLYGKLVALGIE